MSPEPDQVAEFIARWSASSGAELANSQMFLAELCRLLEVPPPDPAVGQNAADSYVFERQVTFDNGDGTTSLGRIDLYRRGCFVLESKQGTLRKEAEDAARQALLGFVPKRKAGAATRDTPGWDQVMRRAKAQAERYVRALPADEGRPPFVLVVDVGHVIEVYAEFSRTGGLYVPFPDPQSHRLRLADLADEAVRDRLRRIWLAPLDLDPSRRKARVTRDIAERLGRLAKVLEDDGHDPEGVAIFLMRCLFTMFAEDVGLLPPDGFTNLVQSLLATPDKFQGMAGELWRAMKVGDFSAALRDRVLRFNGRLFADAVAMPLSADQLRLLLQASEADWADVEPAIFGTLLERALSPLDRHKLGAHYTPRAYVERLVMPTIIEPLRARWAAVQAAAEKLDGAGDRPAAVRALHEFQRELCTVRVLDPACGSGNFLYVTLEHLKRLEGEVLDALTALGEHQGLLEGAEVTVGPHQLLGLEVNPRAAHITELVLWIGYLQWHFRTHGQTPPREPVLHDDHNIECRDAVLAWDAVELVRDEHGKPVTRWDGRSTKPHPVTGDEVPDETKTVPVYRYLNPRPAVWPEADFVVGNPPFIGGWLLRQAKGDGYVQALWSVYPWVPEKADYVAYWWDRAAEATRAGRVRAFGLITTNSIKQVFQRRVLSRHISAAERPLRLAFAVPDHPWTDEETSAAVRIAMTVGTADASCQQHLATVVGEVGGEATIQLRPVSVLNADLSSGADLDAAVALRANSGICSPGVQLYGAGFILSANEGHAMRTAARTEAAREVIRPYLNGRDLMANARGAFVVDFSGLARDEAAFLHPEAYQHILDRVKPERDQNRRGSIRELWWRFGWERPALRAACAGLSRFISTPETAKHRVFVFVDSDYLPDNRLTNVATDDPFVLAVASARPHTAWSLAAGGTLEDRPVYTKTRCFDPFPFADPPEPLKQRIRELGEALDAHRKRQQAAHPTLTLTDMYNVLEKLRAGEALTAKDKLVHEQGLVTVLRQLHDELDAAVFAAYGWPADLSDEELLARLVALNAERAAEERRGLVRWLRPDYQNPHGTPVQTTLNLGEEADAPAGPAPARRALPTRLTEQLQAVREALSAGDGPLTADDVARRFDGKLTAKRRALLAELLEALADSGQARRVDATRFAAN